MGQKQSRTSSGSALKTFVGGYEMPTSRTKWRNSFFYFFFLKISCCRNRLKPHSVIHIPDVFSAIVRYERNYTAKNDLKRCKKKCPRPGLNE